MYNYENYYTNYGTADIDAAAGMLGGLAAFLGIISLISTVVMVVSIISQWIIYKKAGKKGWESIIPVYNIIVLLEIVELPMWYIALFFVPIANIYVIFKIYIELAHKFGKSTGFGVATVFFNFICLPILAFGKNNTYKGGNVINNNQQNTNFVNSEIPMPPQNNNMNYNNSSVQEPMLFNQNINTDINPIPQVQNNDFNMANQNNTTPIQEPQVAFNPTPNTVPNYNVGNVAPNAYPEQQPVSFNPQPAPEQPMSNTMPQGTIPQPVNNIQPQGLNYNTNMGSTPMPNQNPGNIQNNPNM